MGDASFNKGGVNARNLKAGSASFGSADASVSVSFDRPMKNVPEIVALGDSDTDVYLNTKSQTGFTLDRATTGAAQEVSWMAFNDDR